MNGSIAAGTHRGYVTPMCLPCRLATCGGGQWWYVSDRGGGGPVGGGGGGMYPQGQPSSALTSSVLRSPALTIARFARGPDTKT